MNDVKIMIPPDPQKLSIRNENVLDFRKSFFFFAHLLQTSPSLVWLSKFVIIFTHFQIFMATFTPAIVDQTIKGKTDFLTQVYYFFEHFSLSKVTLETYSYLIFTNIVVFFFLLSFVLIIFWAYCAGYRLPRSLSSIRGLLIIFSPITAYVPIVVHLCFTIREISTDISSNLNITCTIIFSIILIIGYYSLTEWASPLLLQTPLLSMGHIPSRLLPDLTHVKYSLIYTTLMAFSLAAETLHSFMFGIVFSCIFGLYQLFSIWKAPYSSIFDTSITLSISLSMIFNPLIYLITYFGIIFNNASYFATCVVVFFIFTVTMYLLCLFRQAKILARIHSNKFEKAVGRELFVYVQTALLYGGMNPHLLHHVKSVYEKESTNDLLIIYCYCIILNSCDIETKVIDQTLTALTQVKSLSWPKQFIAFELYRSFAQTMTLPIAIPKIGKVESLINKYTKLQEKFWDVMIAGNVNEGVNCIHKMKHTFMKASRIYEQLKQFYRYHPKIILLEINFFMTRRKHLHSDMPAIVPANITCDIQQRYSRFIKQQQMSYDMRRKEDNTTTTLSDTTDSRTMTQISNNLHKFLEKPLPLKFLFSAIFYFMLFAAVFSILSYPVFDMLDEIRFISLIPKAFDQMRQISLQWAILNIALKHISNCTEFIYYDCDEIFEAMGVPFREPEGIQCMTIKDITDRLGETAIDTHKKLESFSNAMTTFRESDIIEKLYTSWYDPQVYLLPFENETNLMRDTKIDLRSSLILYLSQIMQMNPDKESDKCYNTYANFTRSSQDMFFNISTSMQIQLGISLQKYKAYIDDMRKNTVSRPWYLYVVIAIIIFISICFSFLLNVLKEHHIYLMLKRHFRPLKNPYTDQDFETLEKPDKFHFKAKYWVTSAYTILIHFIFLLQFFFIYQLIIEKYGDIMNECEAIIEIGNLTQHVSLEIISLLRYYDDRENEILIANLHDIESKMIDALSVMTIAISPLNIRQLWNSDPVLVESERCTKIGDSNFSIHDIESCWPLSRQISVFLFYALTSARNSTTDSRLFRNIQHLYMTHLMDDFNAIAQEFDNFSILTCCELTLFCMIEIGFYIILLLCIIFLESWRILEFSSMSQQISRLFQVLQPKFIASHQCLMDYIIESEETENKKTVARSFFSVYDDAGLSVIVITERMMIVAFTRGVQTLFGYRAEQLIGQPLSILIPKAMSNNVSHNSMSFYQQLTNIRKRQADPVFTRDLLGRSSDGSEVQLHVRASLAEIDDLDFFVVECKSMTDYFYYDMLIQKHKEIFDFTLHSSFPISLFNEMNDEDKYTTMHFNDYILTYVTSPRPEDYSAMNVGMDLSEIKEKVEIVVSYLNGNSNAIVLDVSCSHACILFVDNSGNEDMLFEVAWEFLVRYFNVDQSMNSGLMFKGNDVDVALFAPPQVPSEMARQGFSIEDAKQFIPTMTIEPYAPIFHDIPALIELLKPNKIIITSNLEQYNDETTYSKMSCDLPYELALMDIE
ncbi:hypothetical protein TRFO_30821 [Tritrichomonas foetus]|uniref:PAS fold domain-containing protein n=1 Tax=Tritrichomonas foetus TaxID=1144522 RepID=A0A1J4JSR5_9EUKA|nr:hypothetical protein TRFO_30821 [Tritrichomonas foetus]|eukprot:OHT02167.1 hypothetical protein TRFO_30821 [Tritrichomonas foetus]